MINIFKQYTRILFIWSILFLMVLFFSFSSPTFLSATNILSLLQNSTEIAIVAIGMTLVMILGGIDITVGAALGVLSILGGWMIQANISTLIILPTIVLAGVGIGLVNGTLISFGKIPDIIATIGMMYILRALIFIMLGGRWLTGIPDILGIVTKGSFLGVPILFWLLVFGYVTVAFLLKYTQIGRKIYAVGSNENAAHMIGIPVRSVKIISYAICGGLTGLASLLYLGRLGSVEITIGMELHIQVIAAVVIGGTSVLGGSGSIIGTLAGVFIMAVLRNGINLMGIPSLWERVFIGFFLLLSVAIDMMTRSQKNK
ncbi:MAG: ABC transporter permease [Brevinema sp.]